MEHLQKLISICKGSVTISVNEHRDCYESVEDFLKDARKDIADEVYNEMIARDTVVRIQAYPQNPVGFMVYYHYDVTHAIILTVAVLLAEAHIRKH
jgi:hypothetical protein